MSLNMPLGYRRRPGACLRTWLVIGISLMASTGIVLSGSARASNRVLVPGRPGSPVSVAGQYHSGRHMAVREDRVFASPRKPVIASILVLFMICTGYFST